MAVFGSKLTLEELREITDHDVKMTHPDKVVQDAVFIYCATIQWLLNNKDKADRSKLVMEEIDKIVDDPERKIDHKVREWLNESKSLVE